MDTQRRGHGETLLDSQNSILHLTLDDDNLTYQLKPFETCVWIDTTDVTGDGNAIVTLPSPAECPGQLFFINATTGATGGDVSLVEKGGSEITTYGDMDADNDHAVFFSNGKAWLLIFDGVA